MAEANSATPHQIVGDFVKICPRRVCHSGEQAGRGSAYDAEWGQ